MNEFVFVLLYSILLYLTDYSTAIKYFDLATLGFGITHLSVLTLEMRCVIERCTKLIEKLNNINTLFFNKQPNWLPATSILSR